MHDFSELKLSTSSVVLLSFLDPYPDITLNNFKAWDCSGDESQLSVDVNENEIPICIKGNFSIGSANPGPFTIVYAASVSGVVMGIVPVVQPVDICPEGPW